MKYFSLAGDYLTAYHFCQEKGGQLFCGNGKDSANVVVIGSNCFTFWKEGSKRLLEVKELALQFGLDPEGQTGGRIARWLIDSLLSLPYQDTFWSKTYRSLAKKGAHWHYLYCDTKKPFWGLEVDIKSAYFSSLFSFPSLLYQPIAGYLPDNNALDNLKILCPSLPKWFRLQLLGCLSSWRIFYQCRDKMNPSNKELVQKVRYFVKYNAAFNTAHRAILRNYKIMQKLHEIGGSHVRRIHTDSLLLDNAIPIEVEKKLFDYLQQKGLKYSLKGWGRCFFWDVNTGFIGNKFVGAPIEIKDLMRSNQIKMKRKECNDNVLGDYNYFVPSNIKCLESAISSSAMDSDKSLQLPLFDTDSYTYSNYFAFY